MAGAEDYSEKCMTPCFNIFAMCFNRTPISQLDIYNAIIQNKEGSDFRGLGSVNSSNYVDEEIEEVKTASNQVKKGQVDSTR